MSRYDHKIESYLEEIDHLSKQKKEVKERPRIRSSKLLLKSLKPSQIISFLSLVKNCNHKGLGIYYLLSAFIFGISGTLISVLIRIELYSSGNRIISPESQGINSHGSGR